MRTLRQGGGLEKRHQEKKTQRVTGLNGGWKEFGGVFVEPDHPNRDRTGT